MTDLSGLQVACPQCRRTYFTTTSKFDPTKPPTGNMVYPIVKYSIDWLCSSTTKASEMTCPECLGQLAHTGCLLVKVPIDRIMDVYHALYPDEGSKDDGQQFPSGPATPAELTTPFRLDATSEAVIDAFMGSPIVDEKGKRFQKTIPMNGGKEIRMPMETIPIKEMANIVDDRQVFSAQSGGDESTGAVESETFGQEVEAMAPMEAESGGSNDKYVCPVCGKPAKSLLGLNSHMRSHKGGD